MLNNIKFEKQDIEQGITTSIVTLFILIAFLACLSCVFGLSKIPISSLGFFLICLFFPSYAFFGPYIFRLTKNH